MNNSSGAGAPPLTEGPASAFASGWIVKRHDEEDGSITYQVWDNGPPATYGFLFGINDAINPNAEQCAHRIVNRERDQRDLVIALKHAADMMEMSGRRIARVHILLSRELREAGADAEYAARRATQALP